jgi:hypothetical protein
VETVACRASLIESGINVEGDRAENVEFSNDYVSGADLTGYAHLQRLVN